MLKRKRESLRCYFGGARADWPEEAREKVSDPPSLLSLSPVVLVNSALTDATFMPFFQTPRPF